MVLWDSLLPADQAFLWDLMLVRQQLATCVFAVHAEVHSSHGRHRTPTPHHQPHRQWIVGFNGLRLLLLSLLVPRLWSHTQWILGLRRLQHPLRGLLVLQMGC